MEAEDRRGFACSSGATVWTRIPHAWNRAYATSAAATYACTLRRSAGIDDVNAPHASRCGCCLWRRACSRQAAAARAALRGGLRRPRPLLHHGPGATEARDPQRGPLREHVPRASPRGPALHALLLHAGQRQRVRSDAQRGSARRDAPARDDVRKMSRGSARRSHEQRRLRRRPERAVSEVLAEGARGLTPLLRTARVDVLDAAIGVSPKSSQCLSFGNAYAAPKT